MGTIGKVKLAALEAAGEDDIFGMIADGKNASDVIKHYGVGWNIFHKWIAAGEGRAQRYDEAKEKLDLKDLQGAAEFRGGECMSGDWDSDMYKTLEWKCTFGHVFTGKPHTILKAGHWCPECVPPPWNFDEEARRNPFFAQVWYPNHNRDENNFYAEDCVQDIAEADLDGPK